MFIQKLILNTEVSYSTTADLQNLTENLHLSFKHIPIITPYSSKSDSEKQLLENLNSLKSTTTMTPTLFLKYSNRFDCTHAVISDHLLFSKFGFDLETIKKQKIILEKISNASKSTKLPRLNLFKFFINKQNEEAFVALFVLTEMFAGTVIAKSPKKIEIFFKIFSINWKIMTYSEYSDKTKNLTISGDCVVFMDEYIETDAERIFVIGNSNLNTKHNFEELKLDLTLAGKYKYRVEDVYRSISPAVLKGKKSIDTDRFKNVRN